MFRPCCDVRDGRRGLTNCFRESRSGHTWRAALCWRRASHRLGTAVCKLLPFCRGLRHRRSRSHCWRDRPCRWIVCFSGDVASFGGVTGGWFQAATTGQRASGFARIKCLHRVLRCGRLLLVLLFVCGYILHQNLEHTFSLHQEGATIGLLPCGKGRQ